MRRTSAILLILVCAACSDQATGTFGDKSADELVNWMHANPDVSEKTWSAADQLNCRPQTGRVCGPAGCKDLKPVTWTVWEPGSGNYQRCDDKGCDTYKAQVNYSGAWANVAVPDRAMFSKLTASGQFVEVVSQNDAVWVYHGQCTLTKLAT